VILLLPLRSEADAPHAPPVTLGLIGLNLAAFLLVSGGDPRGLPDQEARLERIAEWSLRQVRRDSPLLEARADRFPSALAFLDQDSKWPEEVASTETRERLAAVLDDYRSLRAAHPYHRHGLVPAHVSAWPLLAHQFLHADIVHLGFNMLFLWAVGAIVEAALGRWLFLSLYLASGAAAALVHVASNPGSVEPAIGASGSVAGVMGTVAVLHGGHRLRLALVAMLAVAPRILFFSLPAWIFVALWLLEQVFFASFGSTTLGVAFGAHLGGFGFGALAGLVGRAGGKAWESS